MSKKLSHYRTQKTAVCLMSVTDDRSYSINCNSILFPKNYRVMSVWYSIFLSDTTLLFNYYLPTAIFIHNVMNGFGISFYFLTQRFVH